MSNEVKIKIKAKNEATGEFKKAESEAKKTADKIGSDFKKMSASIMGGVKAVGRLGASIASAGSLVGPMASALLAARSAVIGFGHALVAIGPAAAVLPGLAASIGFIGLTFKAAIPGITAGLKPVIDSFKTVSARVATLAGKGLPELARQFVKVNMPTIAGDMEWIARSLNAITTNTMKWINSAAGQDMIRVIADSAAEAFERLAPHVDRVVQSLGNMMARVSGNTIGTLADGLGRAADAAARWMDSITADKVNAAMGKIKGYAASVMGALSALKTMGDWMASHQGMITAFSDTLAVAGIALGAATGNIPAILVGVFSLVANHLGDIVNLFTWAWNQIKDDPTVQAIVTSVRGAIKTMVDTFKQYLPQIQEMWSGAVANMKKAWVEWGPTIVAFWDNIGKPVFKLIALGLIGLIAGLVALSSAAASWGAFMGSIFKGVVGVILGALGMIINGAAAAFGWIPGIGPKLWAAASEFNAFRDRVNNTLAGIHDKTVTVRLNYFENRVIVGAAGGMGMKASGGIVGVSRAAAGGPRNNMTLVGEHGPELVNLRPGTMVTPAGKTRSMLNAASGGGTPEPIVLVVSGGTQMDDTLCDILRRAIGRRGGNVQNVLGDAA